MSDVDMFKYGQLVAQVDALDKKVDSMDKDLKELLALAKKGRGGFWVGMAIVSAFSTFVGFVTHSVLGK